MTDVNAVAHPADGGEIYVRPRETPWRRTGTAIGLAAGVNALVYLLASAAGAFPAEVVIPSSGRPITLGPVVTMSAAGAVGGAVCHALLRRFARRPDMAFRRVAAVVLVLSFATPFTLPGAPAAMVATLELMHVVVAASAVLALTRRPGTDGPSRP